MDVTDSDERERGRMIQTAIDKGVLQSRESDLRYIAEARPTPVEPEAPLSAVETRTLAKFPPGHPEGKDDLNRGYIQGWNRAIQTARELAAVEPDGLPLDVAKAALSMVGDAIDASLNDIGLGTPDRLERASTRLARTWNEAHAMVWPDTGHPYQGDARVDPLSRVGPLQLARAMVETSDAPHRDPAFYEEWAASIIARLGPSEDKPSAQ